VGLAAPSGLTEARAQDPAPSISGGDAALIDDIAIGSRILADFGVLDGFGHVSARDPTNPNHFLMSRSLAPALVTADDIMAFDLDGNALDARGRSVFLERFIHGEIYKARPDVMSVVHSHSPGVIPFTVSEVPLRPIYHNAAFLAAGGTSEMILARPTCWSVTPRAGSRVGPSVEAAVFRAYYTDVNAKLQSQAISLGGGVKYLTPEEGAKADAVNLFVLDRIWNLWKRRIAPTLAK